MVRETNKLAWMRSITLSLSVMIAALSSGCSQNPYLANSNAGAWQNTPGTPVNAGEARLTELNRRIQLLDDNNRQLHTQLAQSEQQVQVYRDESEILRRQLAEVSEQLQATKLAANDAEQRVRGMQASSQKRGGATIRPNTNLSKLASRLNLGSVPVLQDGDVIRIVIPADQLFQVGTAQLQPNAASVLDPIAAQLRSVFPRQRIAVEGYSDNAPLYGGVVSNAHQLTSAQASAVVDRLTQRNQMPAEQLFLVAQGANNPRQSNDTPAGRAANRRIELVVYPETF